MVDIGVIHVVYAPYGTLPLQQFLNSYRQHGAGVAHQLILVCKAFKAGPLPDDYRALLAGFPHRLLAIPDGGFDLGSYILPRASASTGFFASLTPAV